MSKEEKKHYKFESLTEFHKVLGLQKPLHPLVSLIDIEDITTSPDELSNSYILNFYKIAYKSSLQKRVKYGQNYFDFGEGGMIFTSPNQVFEAPDDTENSGKLLFVHPDFLLSYPLAKKIKQYGYFSYATNEALHFSDKEKSTIFSIFKIIEDELQNQIDDFSQDVIISQIETLLNYSNRFYKRQFITRKAVNNDLLQKLDDILNNYFDNKEALIQGIPTVQFLSEQLNISSNYLSDMLRTLTGQNAQQHIHNKLIEIAKEKISTTNLTISEIAYELGFEHSSSFNKLFKIKTQMSPLEFRRSFN
jgi:AraC-like DNA-binding protein